MPHSANNNTPTLTDNLHQDTPANTSAYFTYLRNNPPPALHAFDCQAIDKSAPPFVLVDGSYYLFRCYHGMPPLTNRDGFPTGAIRGVLNALLRIIKAYKPSHMVVAFDTKSPTFRHAASSDYKAHRAPIEDDLIAQIAPIHALIRALGIPLLMRDGFEADDLIGTLAYQACQNGRRVVISTGDKDMAQLVNDCVILEDSFTGKITDVAGVAEKFGIANAQMVDYLTLMGDPSDGIMGVPKVGKKTAAKLLGEYGTLDNIIANADAIGGSVGKNILANLEQIKTDRALATIVTNLPDVGAWDDFKLADKDLPTLLALYSQFEFARELEEIKRALTTSNGAAIAETAPKIANSWVIDRTDDTDATDSSPSDSQPTYTAKPLAPTTLIQTQNALDEMTAQLAKTNKIALFVATKTLYQKRPSNTFDWQNETILAIGLAIANTQTGSTAYYLPIADEVPTTISTASSTQTAQNGGLFADEFGDLADNPADNRPVGNSIDNSQTNHTQGLPLAKVLAALRPILENSAIGKIGHTLKNDAHMLAKHGITLGGWAMDTELASYVMQTNAKHDLASLAKKVGIEHTPEPICNKKNPFVAQDLDTKATLIGERCQLIYQLGEYFAAHFTPTERLLLEKIELPIAKTLLQMEQSGILLDARLLTNLSMQFERQIAVLATTIIAQAGTPFNVASPKQLGEILFDKLGLSGGKKTKSGQYATGEDVLAALDHPIADLVLEHRALSKLKSTYTDALVAKADATGRVHTDYQQALTTTGRLSSTDPNLQNIPIRTQTGRQIREAFIAPAGKVIISADYSQIELRLMAHFSQDNGLIDAFNRSIDIHQKTASEILHKELTDVTPDERRAAKAVNFGLLYGMSSFGLAKQLNASRAVAKQYIDNYFSSYPTIYDYMERTKTQAKMQGFVETILGRRLYMALTGNKMADAAILRAAINAPLQGSAAELIKLAMESVAADLADFASAKLLLQVHDELVFEIADQDSAAFGDFLHSKMRDVMAYAHALGFAAELSVPLAVEIGIGSSWGAAH